MATIQVAHDLGNLLQVAGSAIRILDRDLRAEPRPTLTPVVRAALASIERAALLSHRILRSARPCERPVDIVYPDCVVMEMLDELALAAGQAITIELVCDEVIPAMSCHRADLENVILNLVANARDAMSAGGRVTIAVRRSCPSDRAERSRPDILLAVTDTGCGMSTDVMAQALKPFFTTKGNGRGTGLGLALAHEFVGRQNGAIELQSEVGRGTTIVLRLPSCGG